MIGTVARVAGHDDPRVREFAAMSDAELMQARGLFVAEGRLVVERLLADRRWKIRSMLLSDAAYRALEGALAAAAADMPIYLCAASDFATITGYNIHRGCLALVERPEALPVEAIVDRARTVVVLEAVANADNVGGVFRNAAAFGVDAVVLGPTSCDPLYRKAIRTSMAAALRVPFARSADLPGLVELLRTRGFTVVALTPREPAIDLETYARTPRPERIAIVVGAEGAGLAAATEACADIRVRIPIEAHIDSLNLATAAGIALYRLSRP
jgi:tRNA G18 (ribose-2'-O)-methylase SpoU